jgi:hypothetical protein
MQEWSSILRTFELRGDGPAGRHVMEGIQVQKKGEQRHTFDGILILELIQGYSGLRGGMAQGEELLDLVGPAERHIARQSLDNPTKCVREKRRPRQGTARLVRDGRKGCDRSN